MANEIEDAISTEIIKAKKWHLAPARTEPFLEERLMAGFVWQRVRSLLTSVGEANIRKRIDDELGAVRGLLDTKLGPKRNAGTLLSPRPAGSSDTNNHLDLADLALQRASGNEPGKVKIRTGKFIANRLRAVQMIVWRAAVLEADVLWRNSPLLDVKALEELLDRRLRVVERMRYQIADRSEMMRTNNAQFNFVRNAAATNPTKDWFDDLRVRLFEYMDFPAAVDNIPGLPRNVWRRVLSGTIVTAMSHILFPRLQRTIADGTAFDVHPANAWRFPADIADKWQVSLARDGFYMIDLAAAAPFDPVPVIDSLFDYRGTTPTGDPRKKDIWNRAWLLCDQVISATQIEALLFGLRRRDAATAENTFRGLVARRPPFTVKFEEFGTRTLDTAFVALGGYIRNPDERAENAKVLMQSDEPPASAFGDPYFRNERITIDTLQVGDQVKFRNAPIFGALTQNEGIWKLENAFVMEVEPAASNADKRTAVALGACKFQGHGTVVETYDSMRETLGRELDRLLVGIYRQVLVAIAINDNVFFVPQERTTPIKDLKVDTLRIFRWAPFPEITKIRFRVPTIINGKEGFTFVERTSPPWWIPLRIEIFGTDVASALAVAPHAIGGPDIIQAGALPIPQLPEFKLNPGEQFFNKFILYPLFEPAIAPEEEIVGRPPWVSYFKRRQVIGAHERDFQSLNTEGDVTFIPGLFYREVGAIPARLFGTVRPQVRPTP